MSITREEFLKGLNQGNRGYYESVLRLSERVRPDIDFTVEDGKSQQVIMYDCNLYEQVRVDRVTGNAENIVTSLRGARKYKELIESSWYKEAFRLGDKINNLRVHIKDVCIDKIPDKFIVSVYFSYLNYYDCITYNDTKGTLDKRVDSHQEIARALFKALQDKSEDFDPIILDVLKGKYKDKVELKENARKVKRILTNIIKRKLFRRH